MQATEKDSLAQLSLTHYKKKKMEVAEKKRTEVRENWSDGLEAEKQSERIQTKERITGFLKQWLIWRSGQEERKHWSLETVKIFFYRREKRNRGMKNTV